MDSYLITNIIAHCAVVKEFHIRRRDGAPLPDWLPGAHIVLSFASGEGRQFERCYSLLGMPGAATTYRIAVQREERGQGGSVYLHDHLHIGSPVGMSGPFNNFPSQPGQRETPVRRLLIADGIGIATMLSMACALHAQTMPFSLHYLVHDAGQLVLREDLRAIPNIVFHFHGSQQAGCANLNEIVGPYNDGDMLYASGTENILREISALGTQRGWPEQAMHFERF